MFCTREGAFRSRVLEFSHKPELTKSEDWSTMLVVEAKMARSKPVYNRADLIIKTAQHLFARNSDQQTSIEDIARDLAIGKGTVYLILLKRRDPIQNSRETWRTHLRDVQVKN